MELIIFASFRALEGKQELLASEFRVTAARVLTEHGCLGIEFYRSVRDSRLFWLHARWIDKDAFEKHAEYQKQLNSLIASSSSSTFHSRWVALTS